MQKVSEALKLHLWLKVLWK